MHIKAASPCYGKITNMNSVLIKARIIGVSAVLWSGALLAVVAVAAEPSTPKREIIPGSELMTAPERERYRLRLRGAGTAEERERLRSEHVKAMEEQARLRGLKVIDYSRQGARP
jgi:hypothetical protein